MSDQPCGFCGHPKYAHRDLVPLGPEHPSWPCSTYECGCADYAYPGTVIQIEIADNGNTP